MRRLKRLHRMIFDGQGRPAVPEARPQPGKWRDRGITGSCLGHSTVLLNFLGATVITDPVFSTRVGIGIPPFVLGPRRLLEPALWPTEVPSPDVIVLSHAHFDHLDVWSLRKFSRKTPVVTARATGDILRRHGFRNVHELAWGASLDLKLRTGAMRFTALPVQHWGARMLRDTHRGYNGYLMQREGRSVCFAGDTAYTTAFGLLKELSQPLDLILMPIGAYDPWIHNHCSPEEAATMARQAGARTFVPIHHQTFRLSREAMDEPERRIRKAFESAPRRLLATKVGETFEVPLDDSELRAA